MKTWQVFSKVSARSLLMACAVLAGCATYTTPGPGVSIANLSRADADIGELLKAEPASPFPARMAVARIQASGYSSPTNRCYGTGQYYVVTTRDIEPEETFDRITRLPQLEGLALMNRLLLSPNFKSMKDLRLAAASLKTDLLLVYSLDTGFNIDSVDVGPLGLITLGFLPNKKAKVTATASAAIFDVRTGFIYGVAEATSVEEQRATFWSTKEAIDAARQEAEKSAFQRLVGEIEKLWGGVIAAHARTGKRGG